MMAGNPGVRKWVLIAYSYSPPPPPPHPSPPPQPPQSAEDLGIQHNCPPFPTDSGYCLSLCYSHYIEVLLNLVCPPFTWSSLPCSFHCRCCKLLWHSLALHSFNMTIQVQGKDFVNFTVNSPCSMPLSPCLLLLCSLLFLLRVQHIFFTISLSNILSSFVSSADIVRISDPQVGMGRNTVVRTFILIFGERCSGCQEFNTRWFKFDRD